MARDPRVLIGWPSPLGFGLGGRLLLERRGRVYVYFIIISAPANRRPGFPFGFLGALAGACRLPKARCGRVFIAQFTITTALHPSMCPLRGALPARRATTAVAIAQTRASWAEKNASLWWGMWHHAAFIRVSREQYYSSRNHAAFLPIATSATPPYSSARGAPPIGASKTPSRNSAM